MLWFFRSSRLVLRIKQARINSKPKGGLHNTLGSERARFQRLILLHAGTSKPLRKNSNWIEL